MRAPGNALRMHARALTVAALSLLGRILRGEFDPTFVVSHRMPLDQAPEAYRLFDEKADQALKIVLQVAPG